MSAVDDFIGRALSRSELLAQIENSDEDTAFFFCSLPADPRTTGGGLGVYLPDKNYYTRLGILNFLEDLIAVSKANMLADSTTEDGECEHA